MSRLRDLRLSLSGLSFLGVAVLRYRARGIDGFMKDAPYFRILLRLSKIFLPVVQTLRKGPKV